jgi:hypothetical protein
VRQRPARQAPGFAYSTLDLGFDGHLDRLRPPKSLYDPNGQQSLSGYVVSNRAVSWHHTWDGSGQAINRTSRLKVFTEFLAVLGRVSDDHHSHTGAKHT